MPTAHPLLDRPLELHPQVAMRPEPFGALAYHYGTRRLVFLKHPDMVRVVGALAEHPSLAATLDACGVPQERWHAFGTALDSLHTSEIIRERTSG